MAKTPRLLSPSFLRAFLPWLVVITACMGAIYLTEQHAYRMNANDPQVQVAEDTALAIANGLPINRLTPPQTSDMRLTLSPFFIVMDENGSVLSSSVHLDGKTPVPPKGVLSFAKEHPDNRLTWQPSPGVREAIVVKHFIGPQSGYVLVGRSLREVEKREQQLLEEIIACYLVALLLTAGTLVLTTGKKK